MRRRDEVPAGLRTTPALRLTVVMLTALAIATSALAQQQRLATDFEIAQMERQIAQSRGFEAQLGARLNLGDARAARSERTLAREEYQRALSLAETERVEARAGSSLSRYANATSWAGLASAKLGREAAAFALLEEAARYASDDAEAWNVYASAMRILGRPAKAVAAARNAVAIAERSPKKPLDLAVYRHALATAHLDAGDRAEAERLLRSVIETLDAPQLEALRREAARVESFEVYSSARGDVAAYVSLLNRAQLRLAAICEERGDAGCARQWYRRVLDARSDDVLALTALARLAGSDAERERLFAEAFDANPFSRPLVAEYRRTAAGNRDIPGTGTGARMRRALSELERGDLRGARISLDALLSEFPANETLQALRREAEGQAAVELPSSEPAAEELRALLNGLERITPEQRLALDRTEYTSEAQFDAAGPAAGAGAATVLASGTIGGVPFRFATPTAFAGTFDTARPLRLTYRILGVTRHADRDALLLEPVRLERGR